MHCPTLLECLVDYPLLILGIGMVIGCVINAATKFHYPLD
jgi:hypothetical protein